MSAIQPIPYNKVLPGNEPAGANDKILVLQDGKFRSLSKEAFKGTTGEKGATGAQGGISSYWDTVIKFFGNPVLTVDEFMRYVPVPESGLEMRNVYIEDGFTQIDDFDKSSDRTPETITDIRFPKTLTTIGRNAFYGTAITKLNIPESVTHISTSAFATCTQLKEVNIPENCSILAAAFASCSSLEIIKFNNSINTIGDLAFSDCSALKTLNIPKATSIGNLAFSQCIGLKEISIDEGLTALVNSTFYGVNNAIIELPSSLTSLTYASGYGQPIPFNNTVYFKNREGINDVLPDNVTWNGTPPRIRYYRKDYFLSETGLYKQAGSGGGGGESPSGISPYWNVIVKYEGNPILTKEKAAEYLDMSVTQTGTYNIYIEDGFTEIGEDAFSAGLNEDWANCEILRDVRLPETLEIVGNAAFMEHYLLRVPRLPESLHTIGNFGFGSIGYSFRDYEITYAPVTVFPKSIRNIGDGAFEYSCFSEVNIGDNVTVGVGAFMYLDDLKKIVVGDNVILNNRTFANLPVLTDVVMGDVTLMGEGCFHHCNEILTVNIKSCQTLPASTFWNCSKLSSLTIGDKLERIESNAYNSSELIVTVPNTIKYFGSTAILGTKTLYIKGVDGNDGRLPNGVTSEEGTYFGNLKYFRKDHFLSETGLYTIPGGGLPESFWNNFYLTVNITMTDPDMGNGAMTNMYAVVPSFRKTLSISPMEEQSTIIFGKTIDIELRDIAINYNYGVNQDSRSEADMAIELAKRITIRNIIIQSANPSLPIIFPDITQRFNVSLFNSNDYFSGSDTCVFVNKKISLDLSQYDTELMLSDGIPYYLFIELGAL
jgi:hypothetical protein